MGIQEGPCLDIIEMERLSNGLATGFHRLRKFLPTFHPKLQQGATSLTAILKTTKLSVALAFRVDDNEVLGGGDNAKAENGGSVCQQVH